MGVVFDEVAFQNKAPTAAELAAKVTELCGLPVVVTHADPSWNIEGLHDQHAFLAFACLPEEQLEVFSYQPGAAKKFYNTHLEGFEDMPIAKRAVGMNEQPGTQTVYLRSYVGLEPTLMGVSVLALEALGGKPRSPIDDEERRELSTPITEEQLLSRRRALNRKFGWTVALWVLLLPITIPFYLLSLLLALALIPVRIWLAWRMYADFMQKQEHKNLLSLMPNRLDFVAVTPDDFPGLDRGELDRYTQALEALGFVQAAEFEVRADIPFAGRGFARLFIHPRLHCIAEVSQVFPMSAELVPMRLMFGSSLSDDWELTTTDREPSATMWAWRRPRAPWSSHPRFLPAELLDVHLRRRERMIELRDIHVLTDLTFETYCDCERKAMADRKLVLTTKTMATINAEMKGFEKAPHYEWTGELSER